MRFFFFTCIPLERNRTHARNNCTHIIQFKLNRKEILPLGLINSVKATFEFLSFCSHLKLVNFRLSVKPMQIFRKTLNIMIE